MKSLRYYENKQRGSQEFPLDYYYVDQRHPRYEMPYHWHDETEIIHVISGQFQLMLDGVSRLFQEGEMAYVSSGCLHGGEPQNCVYECVVFDLRMLLKIGTFAQPFLHDVNSRRIDVNSHFADTNAAAVRCLMQMFEALREQAEGREMIAAGALLCFFGEIKRERGYATSLHSKNQETRNVLKLKRVFEMIENSPDNPPTVAELASAVGMVPKYFCRFFRTAAHYKPSEYIAFYRVEQACYEIAATEKNVTEIAMGLGFSDVSSFIRSFKRFKGVTPGEYIKMMRTGGTQNVEGYSADPVPGAAENSL